MARQQVHNRRAGRGNSGSAWISYSDIMAALVLVFVLFLVLNLYRYNELMAVKTRELNAKQALLDAQQLKLDEQEGILIIQQGKLDEQSAELENLKIDLEAKQTELDNQTIILIGQQAELDAAKATLAAKETELKNLQLQLDEQQKQFRLKTQELNTMVGVRSEIVAELTSALAANNLGATIDANGNITLESAVFFQKNSYEIREDGQALLKRFLPVYLGVLLKPEYADYLGEIIIEGHTDSSGTYTSNLRLSQNRALAVAIYCLDIVRADQRHLLQSIMTATGRSSSDPVLRPDGTEDMDASRRVEFKFSLRDAEMIDEMNAILQDVDAR